MKKKILGGVVLLAVAAILTLNVNRSKSDLLSTASLTSLTKTAMADCEVDGWVYGNFIVIYDSPCYWRCLLGGDSACPI